MKAVLTPAGGRRARPRDPGSRDLGGRSDGTRGARRGSSRRRGRGRRLRSPRRRRLRRGNNGGDGLVAARHLPARGCGSTSWLSKRSTGRGPASSNLARMSEQGLRARRGRDAARGELARADVVVDAIFGTGFHGKPEGDVGGRDRAMNASPSPVVAADIPSGVDGSTGAVTEAAVWADLTVAFGAAKVGSVLLPGAERSGTVRVVDIGFPDDIVRPNIGLTEPGDVAGVFPKRSLEGHKRSSGVLLVVAGSRAMTGRADVDRARSRLVSAPASSSSRPRATPDRGAGAHRRRRSSCRSSRPGRGRSPSTRSSSARSRRPSRCRGGRSRAHAYGETARLVRELVNRSPVPW